MRQRMGWAKTDKQMNMIGHTSNDDWMAAHSTNRSSDIFVEPLTPGLVNQWLTSLGTKNNMVIELRKRIASKLT
jgi:hypothetical protein